MAMALSVDATELVDEARQRFAALRSYRVTLRSTSAGGVVQMLRYYYRTPGFVRLEFIKPHTGAVLIYRPTTGKVRLWPFGLDSVPVLTLAPDNPLLRGVNDHRIDRSDVGVLLTSLQQLAEGGRVAVLSRERVGQWTTRLLEVTGPPGKTVAGVHRYQVWLADEVLFPVKVSSFDARDRLREVVLMDDVLLDDPQPVDLFEH